MFMRNDLGKIVIIFGQITTATISILLIWIFGDSDICKKIISYLWFRPLVIKSILTFIIMIGLFFSIWKKLDELIKNEKKR